VIGRTTDELGQAHTLVLHAPGIREAVRKNRLFAVLSGSTTFSVTGDAVVGPWRFVVDSSATGEAAPIVVLKYAKRSVADLAADPASFTNAAGFNEDVLEASARLQALVATTTARAHRSDAGLYESLADALNDPNWTGVLVFNASVSPVPAEVLGRSTGELAGTRVVAYDIGFSVSAVGGAGGSTFFATIDHFATVGDAASDAQWLRARFANDRLVSFQLGRD
jgi:hypothetical protein